jgi:macrolide-specific efflux system membrane fusion protein
VNIHASRDSQAAAGFGSAPAARFADRLKPAVGSTAAAFRRRPLLYGGILAALLAIAAYFVISAQSTAGAYITAAVAKGDIEDTVTAVGNLQPRDYVDVGAQVSGQLKKLYVNIGDTVKQGQLLAEIDPQILSAKVQTDQSNLSDLKAQLADKQAQFALARADFARQQRLKAADATSQSAYDAARQAMSSAQAQVNAAAAQIQASDATLSGDKVTLGYTKIYSPMDGTVASITTKQGMTVNANQQAPIILRVADLSKMTVWTQVSEADVPKLTIGMPACFTTLGEPDKRWYGKLTQIQPTPTVTNNVVLYTATFDVDNPGNQLMTQMTAQVFFVVASAHDVATVPVSALHQGRAHSGNLVNASASNENSAARQSWRSHNGARRHFDPAVRAAMKTSGAKRYWVQVMEPDGTTQSRPVVVGVTNRVSAQILAGLSVGDTVVVGRKQADSESSSANHSDRQRSNSPGGFRPPGFP